MSNEFNSKELVSMSNEFDSEKLVAIFDGVRVTEQKYWELHMEQLVKEGVTKEKLYELMLDLDMNIGESLYVDDEMEDDVEY